jgi:hypothetical protein
MRRYLSWISLLPVTFLVGCGSQGSPPPPPPPPPTITSVAVSPPAVSLLVKAPQQFTAAVQGTGAFNPAVTWLVSKVPGGNATVGTINSSGLYTAPSTVPSPNTVTVTAQSVQDTTKSGTGAVTINLENVKISVSPPSSSAQLSTTLQFNATVTGTVNTAVFWGVNNFPGGQSFVGFIDGNGNYSAPSNLPANNPVTITATSQEDTTKTASAAVTILATASGITLAISPQRPSVVFDGSQSIQFTASVSGTSNTAVTWSVDSFSFPSIGQISPTGLFTPFGFNCSNVPPTGAIRAVSAANAGAQAVSLVNLVPPAPVITGLSSQPADAETLLQLSGTFALGAALTVFYPGPNATSIPGGITGITSNGVSGPVPLGASSGSLSLQQTCVSGLTGFQYPSQESNSLPFVRLPRLRIRADRQVLTSGESTQVLAAFLGDPTPQPITWSALFGTVSSSGVFTAGSSNWDKVTGCITGTQQCDFFVFSVVAARIEPAVPIVPMGGSIQLSEVQGTTTLSPTWSIAAGGGTLSPSGLYTAATTPQDAGAIPITATASAGTATDAVSVVGGFLGLVNRVVDFPDISANATGQTTIPKTITADGNRVYVLSDNLPFIVANGHYKWIDVYDVSDPARPVWVSAVEGFDGDLDIQPMQTFASNGFLWRVTAPQIINGAGSLTSEVAFYESSSGQPSLKQFFTVPRMWVYNFYKGLLIGIPSSFTPTGIPLWQSQATALVFDGRSGTLFPSQISLVSPNPTVGVSIDGIAITDTRLFLFLQQQQSDGSLPFFLSTYDLTSSPPTLLQTTSAQAGPLLPPGESAARVFGNLLYAGGSVYDISSGLPVFQGSLVIQPPDDMSGSLALLGPFPDGKYRQVDYSMPARPKVTGILYTGDDFNRGPGRFVGGKAYIAGSGAQIFDVTAPGGPIPLQALEGSGAVAFINDLLFASSNLYAAELTDVGPFVTSFDFSQTPPQRIGSFALGNETPFALSGASHFLFVGTSTELVVLDVTNPAAPVKITSLALPTSSLKVVGNVLYDGTTDNRLVVIDVTNPASPVVGTSTNLAGFPNTMQANANLLLIAADTAGLLIFSISNPSAPVLLSQFQPSSAVEGVVIDGNLALLAATDGGFVIADLTNPSAPVLAGQVPLAVLTCFADLDPADGLPGLISISLNNGIAYVGGANMFGRVFGFDYRQTSHPRLVSEASYGDAILESVFTMAFFGSNIFVAGDLFADRVFQADITQPRNFIREKCLPPPFGANAVAVFPELRTQSFGSSIWNPKTHIKRDWTKHPLKEVRK